MGKNTYKFYGHCYIFSGNGAHGFPNLERNQRDIPFQWLFRTIPNESPQHHEDEENYQRSPRNLWEQPSQLSQLTWWRPPKKHPKSSKRSIHHESFAEKIKHSPLIKRTSQNHQRSLNKSLKIMKNIIKDHQQIPQNNDEKYQHHQRTTKKTWMFHSKSSKTIKNHRTTHKKTT